MLNIFNYTYIIIIVTGGNCDSDTLTTFQNCDMKRFDIQTADIKIPLTGPLVGVWVIPREARPKASRSGVYNFVPQRAQAG